jgi:hypothetical protein
MISYLVYLVAFQGKFKGLNVEGTLEVQHIYNYYLQLKFSTPKRHYKRVNNAFLMHIVRDLAEEFHVRILSAARAAILEWADWFIQFSTFTYIRAYNFSGTPAMLSRYPTNEVMITKFLRQMYEVHTFLRNQRKASFTFHFELGIYRCRSSVDAKAMSDMSEELPRFNLKWFTERKSYDPRGTFASRLSQNFAHVPAIEDF